MSEERRVHEADQAIAAFVLMAAGLAKAYVELCEGGVPPDHAVKIVVQLALNFAPPQPPKDSK